MCQSGFHQESDDSSWETAEGGEQEGGHCPSLWAAATLPQAEGMGRHIAGSWKEIFL